MPKSIPCTSCGEKATIETINSEWYCKGCYKRLRAVIDRISKELKRNKK